MIRTYARDPWGYIMSLAQITSNQLALGSESRKLAIYPFDEALGFAIGAMCILLYHRLSRWWHSTGSSTCFQLQTFLLVYVRSRCRQIFKAFVPVFRSLLAMLLIFFVLLKIPPLSSSLSALCNPRMYQSCHDDHLRHIH